MYGMEKKGKAPFEFDLERELKAHPAKIKELFKDVDSKIVALKHHLRQGSNSADFNQYGKLLHAFAALRRVLDRIANKK
jgi:hypothetical protein